MDSLSSALDTESGSRKQLETEREQLRAKLEKATLSLQATTRRYIHVQCCAGRGTCSVLLGGIYTVLCTN